jgi:hypothetical protein
VDDACRASFNSVSIRLFQLNQGCPTRIFLTLPRLSQVEALIEHVRASEVVRLQRVAIQVPMSICSKPLFNSHE